MLKWGTGGINIDGCRIEGAYGTGQNEIIEGKQSGVMYHNYDGDTKPATGHKNKIMVSNPEGRFPANIILECCCDELLDGGIVKSGSSNRNDKGTPSNGVTGFWRGSDVERHTQIQIHTNPNCPCYILDEQSGISGGGTKSKTGFRVGGKSENSVGLSGIKNAPDNYGDKGGASRFFYISKVSKKERNMGLDGFEDKVFNVVNGGHTLPIRNVSNNIPLAIYQLLN